jgi:hypothetical protein
VIWFWHYRRKATCVATTLSLVVVQVKHRKELIFLKQDGGVSVTKKEFDC